MSPNRKKIAVIATSDITIKAFFVEHLRTFINFYDLTVITNTTNHNFLCDYGINVKVIPLKIKRKISPISDFFIFFKLILIFRKNQFDLIQSITPKAGLLSMMAGNFCGIPIRIHIFTGQIWATTTNYKRRILKLIDKILVFCSTNLLADSESQRLFLISENVVKKEKIKVLANGSVGGIDINRFKPDKNANNAIRNNINIKSDDFIFLYVGRLKYDKGVLDLAKSFMEGFLNTPNAYLIFLGSDEENLKQQIQKICNYSKNVYFLSHTCNPDRIAANPETKDYHFFYSLKFIRHHA